MGKAGSAHYGKNIVHDGSGNILPGFDCDIGNHDDHWVPAPVPGSLGSGSSQSIFRANHSFLFTWYAAVGACAGVSDFCTVCYKFDMGQAGCRKNSFKCVYRHYSGAVQTHWMADSGCPALNKKLLPHSSKRAMSAP